jgi:hypothetical protein
MRSAREQKNRAKDNQLTINVDARALAPAFCWLTTSFMMRAKSAAEGGRIHASSDVLQQCRNKNHVLTPKQTCLNRESMCTAQEIPE